MLFLFFQLAVLDLNSADGQGAGIGRKYLYITSCLYFKQFNVINIYSFPGRYIPPHLRNKDAPKSGMQFKFA